MLLFFLFFFLANEMSIFVCLFNFFFFALQIRWENSLERFHKSKKRCETWGFMSALGRQTLAYMCPRGWRGKTRSVCGKQPCIYTTKPCPCTGTLEMILEYSLGYTKGQSIKTHNTAWRATLHPECPSMYQYSMKWLEEKCQEEMDPEPIPTPVWR